MNLTDNKCFNAGVSGRSWLGNSDCWKEDPELAVEQTDVLPSEYLGHEGSSQTQHVSGDVQSSKQQLGLGLDLTIRASLAPRNGLFLIKGPKGSAPK